MIKYTISPPYPWQTMEEDYELDIKSETLEFLELDKGQAYIQVKNLENKEAILERCKQITALIREINQLNE